MYEHDLMVLEDVLYLVPFVLSTYCFETLYDFVNKSFNNDKAFALCFEFNCKYVFQAFQLFLIELIAFRFGVA